MALFYNYQLFFRRQHSETYAEADAINRESSNIARDGQAKVRWRSSLPTVLRVARPPPTATYASRTLLAHRQQQQSAELPAVCIVARLEEWI